MFEIWFNFRKKILHLLHLTFQSHKYLCNTTLQKLISSLKVLQGGVVLNTSFFKINHMFQKSPKNSEFISKAKCTRFRRLLKFSFCISKELLSCPFKTMPPLSTKEFLLVNISVESPWCYEVG